MRRLAGRPIEGAKYTKPSGRTFAQKWQQWLDAFGVPPYPASDKQYTHVLMGVFYFGATAFSDLLQDATKSPGGVRQLMSELDAFVDMLRNIVTGGPLSVPIFRRVSFSQLTDDERQGMTHVCRGAEYVHDASANTRLQVHFRRHEKSCAVVTLRGAKRVP